MYRDMARVSDDHADESMCMENAVPFGKGKVGPRQISPDEVRQHNGRDGNGFWAVIDGFVVDASEFVDSHPGGLKKLLSADDPAVGASGRPFGFSFSRGRNAHFPATGKRFQEGVQRFLAGASTDVTFPQYGKIVILGRLKQ